MLLLLFFHQTFKLCIGAPMPKNVRIPRFKIQRLVKLSILEEFHLLFADNEEMASFQASDIVFGRFLYYEEQQKDIFEEYIQCRLILFEDFEKEQVEGILEELFYMLGLEDVSSSTDVFFAPRERAFSLVKEHENEYEEGEDEEEDGIEGRHQEVDAAKLSLPKKDEPD